MRYNKLFKHIITNQYDVFQDIEKDLNDLLLKYAWNHM